MIIPTRCVAETDNLEFIGQKLVWMRCWRKAKHEREGWPVCWQHGKAKHFNPHPEVRR